jgi:trans-aconitate methyltransferase
MRSGATSRHPWELARARAILRILAHRGRFEAALDYGCGDGFTGREVQRAFSIGELVGVDSELPLEACGVRAVPEGSHELARDESTLNGRKFDLLLLCDVIEHIENDRDFVRGIAQRRMREGALVIVTVPAFQSLFSEHDRALRHYRRYSLPALQGVLREANFELLESGYLFSSLLLPRLIAKAAERVRTHKAESEHGIGSWSSGDTATRWLTRALEMDNSLLLSARRIGLAIPGLSAWALCKTR